MPIYEEEGGYTRDDLEKMRRKHTCRECGGSLDVFLDVDKHKAFLACRDWHWTHHEGTERTISRYEKEGLAALNIKSRGEIMTSKDIVVRDMVELTPRDVVDNATAQAKLLMDIVEKTNCFQLINGKKYLQVEAWETIGAFNRTHAETESIVPISVDGEVSGYQARVQLWKDGVVVGGAIMPCYFTENCCKGKEGDAKHKASMSAAQTFATSKAYRMNFSYVAILAGYQPLPAEEITDDMHQNKTEHWCEEHQANYFKRGKMKFYAHPIDGTEPQRWCNEAKPKNGKTAIIEAEVVVAEPIVASDEPILMPDPSLESGFDHEWLTESLKAVNWKEATVKSYLKNIYQVDTSGTVTDVVSRLDDAQLASFIKELQDRLQML